MRCITEAHVCLKDAHSPRGGRRFKDEAEVTGAAFTPLCKVTCEPRRKRPSRSAQGLALQLDVQKPQRPHVQDRGEGPGCPAGGRLLAERCRRRPTRSVAALPQRNWAGRRVRGGRVGRATF